MDSFIAEGRQYSLSRFSPFSIEWIARAGLHRTRSYHVFRSAPESRMEIKFWLV
ncbi:hypothetical protein Bind_2035 [Beijerinckia indica subsp. indica ATCC 9039]|uniref:Uncharacterized protein n=1 Tax=Beijerinckia indica subsp. indica (strain ATCC 9039 / DSM 1715 / NCIMB 8712) TaxID=395963 RepID=B2IF92_BEII9|nr:hypothetical protein Bind_2035 [Beijerinckia indica subsp. indica ATCC 9039]